MSTPGKADAAGRLLLIGAKGFVGRAVADHFESQGWKVFGTTRQPNQDDAYLKCDLLDVGSLSAAIEHAKPDAIINAAGESSIPRSRYAPVLTMTVNATGVMSLLHATLESRINPYVLTLSSAAVYGNPVTDEAISEEHPVLPESPYAISKATAETICDIYMRMGLRRIGVARIFNQVGPGQSVEQAPSEFATRVAEAEAAGQTSVAVPVREPDAARDFIDVRDTARAFQTMIETRAAGCFNVCTGRAVPLRELIHHLDALSPLDVMVSAGSDSKSGLPGSRASGASERLRSRGWSPQISLRESLADLLEDRRRKLETE